MADAGVDVRGGALEGGVARRRARGRVGDAPVRATWVVRELGADLAGPVAQGDHVVEPATGDRVEVPRALAGDVDAVRARAAPGRRWGAGRAWGGCRRWPPSTWPRRGGAAGPRRSVSGRCCRCRRTARRRPPGPRVGRGGGSPGQQRRMQRRAGVGQRVGAAVQVQVVVAVAAVEAAAGGGDEPAVAQQPQVVGDQVLLARPTRAASSRTRWSLSASSVSSRHRSGWPVSRKNGGAVRPGGSMAATIPQNRLMHQT